MSWDVLLMSVPPNIGTVKDIPDDSKSVLGPKSTMLLILAKICPEANFTDPNWGILNAGDFSIEFNIGEDDPTTHIMLHVRGADSAVNTIQKICEVTGWRALDTSMGDFIDFHQNPTAGLHKWRQFRDQVMASLEAKGEQIIHPGKGTFVKNNKRGR